MKTNYHTHTARCNHADGKEEDYVLEAIKQGVSILGFSDHGPYKDDKYALRMEFCELEDYINQVRFLQNKYKDKINIKCGLELEYAPNQKQYYKDLFDKYKIDYLVLGQHFYFKDNQFINSYCLTNSGQFIDYAKSVVEGMKTGFFKFLAHPDVVFINDIKWDTNCEKCCDIIIKNAKEQDFILEFNANGVRKGVMPFNDGNRFAYPYEKFWEMVAKHNIKVIVNSDCHSPSEIFDDYVLQSYNLAKKWGLNIITEIF